MRILSEGKFRKFDGFKLMGVKDTVLLEFDGTAIECTDDHEFLNDDGEWKQAKNITCSDTFNSFNFLSSKKTNKKRPVYDAINVEKTKSFYAEGLTAHNCSMLYIDETAFVENWDEFAASVLPTISSGNTTKVLYTSTPNGLNHFYKICHGAKENTNGFAYVEVPWWRVPGRDDKWKKEALDTLDGDMQKFRQEYELAFLGSSGTLVDGSKLKQLVPKDPLIESNGLRMYAEYEKDHQYVCIVDTSRGKGLDYSAFSIIDVTKMPYHQVCTFKDNMVTPVEYVEIIYRTCKSYGECAVLVEINDIGQQVSDSLYHDYEYDNVLSTESSGRNGKRISAGFKKNSDSGIRTTKTVKSIGCNMLKLMIEQDQLIINDMDTINELSTFSRKRNSYEAEGGCNDDLVMTLVLFGWLSDQRYFKDITNINTLAQLRQKSEEDLYKDLAPFGFHDNGIHDDEEGTVVDPHWSREDGWLF